MKEKTLVIIKPDGVKKRLAGECLKRFERAGLGIAGLKVAKLRKPFMGKFYAHLKPKLRKKLFNAVIDFMCSGKVVMAVIEGENAVARVRKICGPTNPKEAPKGTIRGDFSTDDLAARARQNKATRNIIHASGSEEDARSELKLIRL